ncbi:cysteine hydrolase family protein [Candidatus Nitrososphaera evergladensis]|uniref:cysteine hydrolase family protein n=1 Tax=Candidatus Nitrososphaera evergladensis TaxID=1459637 RepID=UPI00130E5442|nr:cysteine hydrolase family protein [Candidatus Nitrososphaera evergladensis]
MVIDVQNCFMSEGGSYDILGINISDYNRVLPNICSMVSLCRDKGIPIFYMMAVREPSGVDLLTKTHKFLPKPREERIESAPICVKGTWDADIIDSIKKSVDTSSPNVIIKRRDSAFFGTELDKKLCDLKVDTVIICGVDTSICVETSLRDAFNLGYDVVLVSDATASMDAKRYECTLEDVRNFFGLVLDSKSLLKEVGQQVPEKDYYHLYRK